MELVELDVAALTAHWAKLLQSRGIRGTSDPTRFAVVDVIKDATGLCKPENAWDALKRRRDDLVARCTVQQFRGGPGTVVATSDVLADIVSALRNPEARKFCRRFAAQAATNLEDARPATPEKESDASEEDRDAQPASDTQEAEDLAESLMSEDVASELHSENEVTDIETQLSQVFGRSVDIHIRKTPEGQVALIDIAMMFTGMDNNHSAQAIRNLIREHTEVNYRIVNFKFPGRGQRTVDVANLATALEFAFLLPGRAAARVRRQAATLLVRYLGGDTRLIDEVCQNRRVQEALAAAPAEALTPDEQAVRLCGEAVEAHAEAAPSTEGSVFVPCNPLIIRDEHAVGLPGSDHLYAARRRGEDCNLMKIGISNDVLQRVSSLAQTFGAPYELLAVWPHEAVLESQVFELLKPAKASLGTSREHFSASFEQICQVVVAARNLYRMNAELEALGTKRKRGDESELQEELADRALRRRRAEVQIKREELQLKHDDPDRCLLHDLVKQGDDEARRTFLAMLTAAR